MFSYLCLFKKMMSRALSPKYFPFNQRKSNLFKRVLLMLLLISFSANAQYIQVDDSFTAQQLVEEVFIGTDNLGCIEVSNVSMSNYYNFGGGQMSYGYFNKGNSNFDIEEGIILTTGKARSAVGPNNVLLSEGPAGGGWPGDVDLEEALGINNTTNTTALEFDFIAYTNNIRFEYLFASEQYLISGNSNQCNYTDGFAFLIKKANTNESYQNLAVIPGTTTPVAVNTVRGPGGLCQAINEQYFGSYNDVEHPVNYNGQTIVMTAQTQVELGELYHIKLVIADQGNNLYDSAVFLKGGSFGNGTRDLGEDRLISNGNPVCGGGTFAIDATIPNADIYQWYRNGEAISGATNPVYEITQTGDYEVVIGFSDASCVLKGNIRIEFSPNPAASNTTLVQCEINNGNTVFNLTQAESNLIPNPGNFDFTYFVNLSDAQNNSQNNISNPQNYVSSPNQTIYVRVENGFGCYSVAELLLSVSDNPLQNPIDLEGCEDGLSGLATFDLTENQNEIIAQSPTNATFGYFESFEEALLGSNPIPAISSYQAGNNTTIYIKISENGNCFGIVWFNLIVRSFDIDLSDQDAFMCEENPITIAAPGGYSDYSWNNGQTTQSIEITTAGNYTVTFTNEFGCQASKTFVVSSSSVATITSIEINDMTSGRNTVLVNAEGLGDYEFSINGIDYQDSNFFTSVPSGQHLVFVRDKNGCGFVTQSIFVLEYPKYFTPNADGTNDHWRIPMLSSQYPAAYIEIYDRYGKLLYGFRAQHAGWDGTLNAVPLPATDYWFVVRLPARTVRGHFSLIR